MDDATTDTPPKQGQTGAPANKASNPPKMILKAGAAQPGNPGNVNAAQNRPIAPGARGH
jgi:hypothetical protein